MNAKFKYVIVVCLMLFSLSSYSQRLVIEGNQVIVDTYGMNKDVLAVTAAQQSFKKDPDTGQTIVHKGINSPYNRMISGKFQIANSDYENVSVNNSNGQCATMGKNWRLATLNESLLMMMLYPGMQELKSKGKLPSAFKLPSIDRNIYYATSTWGPVEGAYVYYWSHMLDNPARLSFFYLQDNPKVLETPTSRIRCIRDIPQ